MGLWFSMVVDFRILLCNILQSLIYSLDDTATVKKVHIGAIRGKGGDEEFASSAAFSRSGPPQVV